MIDFSTHPWMSGLFGDDDITAIFAADAELKRLLQVEAAWTRALGHVEGAPQADRVADAIEAADIAPQDLQDGFARDGVPIPALVKILHAQVGPDATHWVHKGLTSQDVMDTNLVLALQDVLHIMTDRLKTLDQQLDTLQRQAGAARIMAYTRMQPALETTAAECVARWRQPLSRLISDLHDTRKTSGQIQWGGPIGMRDHPKADELGAKFANHLALQDPGVAWHSDRTLITQISHIMGRVAIATGKIGEDIALMAATQPAQISLAGGRSSAMPHKNNPVKAETLIALSDIAATLQTTLMRSARHEGFRSGQAWTLEWLALPQLCVVTGAGLIQAALLIGAIKKIGVT